MFSFFVSISRRAIFLALNIRFQNISMLKLVWWCVVHVQKPARLSMRGEATPPATSSKSPQGLSSPTSKFISRINYFLHSPSFAIKRKIVQNRIRKISKKKINQINSIISVWIYKNFIKNWKEAQDKCVNEKYVKEEGSAPLPSVYN